MNKIFPLDDENFCKRFRKKDNPELYQVKLPKYLSNLSKLSLDFAKIPYFQVRLCLLHGKANHLYYFNFPNIEVVDDNSLLFLLKVYKLYELIHLKMIKLPDKNDVIIFNDKVDFDVLSKNALIQSIHNGRIFQSLTLTKEDMIVILSIKFALVLDFENPDNYADIFNGYLRADMQSIDFLKKMDKESKTKSITSKTFENYVGIYFNELKKNNPNFLKNSKKQFHLLFNDLIEKLKIFYKTDEFKKYQKKLIVQPFSFPMKEYFGKLKPIQYQCFKKLVDEFEAEAVEKLGL